MQQVLQPVHTPNRTARFILPVLVAVVATLVSPGSRSALAQDEPAVVSIQTAQEGPPISEYVYGQFIEHLGRCIYGGIWAEMLEDRKFWEEVGSEGLPWKVIGPAACVRMRTEESFVGEHTPEVSLAGDGSPRGLLQDGLALVAGKRYTGRIWLAGSPEAAPVEVALVWGQSEDQRQTVTVDEVSPEYAKTPLEFESPVDAENARLEIVSRGSGVFRVGTASLMPADNVHGMRPDTLALLKELDGTNYRWPGGNFVSGYDWRDGIGDRDRRPPRKNPAWQGIEHNDFGIDEFMVFCRILDTEPIIVVNTGLGDVEMAIEELQYVNGPADSPMGKLRAENGHPEPYDVTYWGIGNEMYGEWQLGHMPLEDYVKKHNRFAEAMWEEDPDIKLVAVGAVGSWTEGMFTHSADHMDLISEHFYVQSRDDLVEHVEQAANRVRQIAEAHRRYREEIPALADKEIPVTLDEWNYWYGEHVYGELGTRYYLRDGLGVAEALNEFARNTDVYAMANYAQTVNVIGAIKTTQTDAAFETTGLMLKMYRHHFGTVPVRTSARRPLDAQAALAEDGKTLTVAVVNPTEEPVELQLEADVALRDGTVNAWQVAGDDPMAYNEPGKPLRIDIQKRQITVEDGRCRIAPLSATILALPVDRPSWPSR